jgi:hypothetical protein
MDVYDLARLHETFDVVLFLGVLYHLRYPLLGLDLVAEKVAGTLVLQTLTQPGEQTRDGACRPAVRRPRQLADPAWPSMAFIEHRLADDPTNWWAPTPAAVEAMVRSTGLRSWAARLRDLGVRAGRAERARGRAGPGHRSLGSRMQILIRDAEMLEQQGYAVLRSAVDPSAVATALRRPEPGDPPARPVHRRHLDLPARDLLPAPAVGARDLGAAAEARPSCSAGRRATSGGIRRSCCASRRGAAVDVRAARRRAAPWAGAPGLPRDRRCRPDHRGAQDGVACVWPGSHRGVPGTMTPVPLEAGDALVMHPQLGHTGTLNLGPTIRTAIYFRLLAGPSLGA